MKILVTGAGGFIGGYLLKKLLAAGHKVRGLALDEADAARIRSAGDVEVVFGDIRDVEALREAALGADAVIHAAARVSDWGTWPLFQAITVRGTQNMLQAAADAGVGRFLLFSSTAVYPRMARGAPPMDETSPYAGPDNPWGFYGRSKILAEGEALRYQREGRLGVTIIRPVSIYGPGDRTFFPRIIRYLRSPTAAWVGSHDPYVPFLYVTDAAEGAMLAATSEKAAGKIYTLGPDPEFGLREFLGAICRELNLRPPRFTVPYALAAALGNVSEGWARSIRAKEAPSMTRMSVFLMSQDQRFDVSKARRDLGWQSQVSMEDGVRLTADWIRQEEAPKS
jgi:nucleoside-diphosphate-sugar epimerase